MPPHARNEDRVTRFDLRQSAPLRALAKARVLVEIRILEIDETDGLSAGSWLQRTRIQVEYLFRRKQREAALADHAACNVVRSVEVAGRNGPIANPYGRGRVYAMRGKPEVVVLAKSWKVAVDQSRADVDRRRPGVVEVLLDAIEHVFKLAALAAKFSFVKSSL